MPNSIADNLTRLQTAKTAIGNAITTQGGTVNVGDGLEEFAADIATIPSGGGGASGGSDVIFYDYDGTIVTSYSVTDFANLSAMPANPTHAGLTAQGWNWTLSDAKTYVAAYGKLNIGQMYITSDGKTRLYNVISKDSSTFVLYLSLDEDTELDIDWGDGTEHTTWTYDPNDDSGKSHEYSDGGRYTISITVISGEFGFSSPGYEDYALKKVEIGNNVTTIGEYVFSYYQALSSITIPNSVTSIQSNAFQNCFALSSITIPNSVTTIGSAAFQTCQALSSITIPNSVTSIEDGTFSGCYALSSITIPSSVTSIENGVFDSCQALSSITIPSSVTSIGGEVFRNCQALSSVTIPNGVTTIGNDAFNYCYALSSITFESTTPPELDEYLGISTTACIIRVPQGTLSDYTSASNYPDPSQYIYEEY